MLNNPELQLTNLQTHASPVLTVVIDRSGFKKLTLAEDYYIVVPNGKDNPYSDVDLNEKVTLRVHKGTSTNFATIPWFVRSILSPMDPILALPSLVHDALVNEFSDSVITIIYASGATQSVKNVPWKVAADTMLGLMKQYPGRLNYLKARLVYSAVRAYGYVCKFK